MLTCKHLVWLAIVGPLAGALDIPAEAQQTRPQAPGQRSDHNYQDHLQIPQPGRPPIDISEIRHVRVYQTETPPRWSCWTSVWFTPDGQIRVSFVDMSGGTPDQKPSYGYEYAGPKALAEKGIRRCQRWCESRDGAATWNPLREIDASDPTVPLPMYFLLLDDRSVLGIGGVWHEWDFQKNTYINLAHTMAWRSTDAGTTWSSPVSLNDPNRTESFCCRPRQLRDGTIVLPAYGTLDKSNRSPSTDAWLWFSSDRGRTWSAPVLLANGLPDRSNDEPELTELGDGRLLVILRHSNPQAKGGAVYLNCGQTIVTKTPSGWQAGPVRQTNLQFRGFPALLRTRDGILICAGSGNQFNFSLDEAATWSPTTTIGDPAHNRPNHYPMLLELPDARVLSVYHVGNHWPYPPPQDEWIHATTFRPKKP